MGLEVLQASTSRQIAQFIDLEWELNKNTPNWVSPLRMERKKIFDTRKNPFYKHAQIALFIARRDGKNVGRIAAIRNDNHNRYHQDRSGFWGFFECIDDQEVANALFNEAAQWLRNQQFDTMIGPMNPSTNDECGLLIDGFDTPPFLMMTHNPDFYPRLVEGFGNTKVKDLYAWYLTEEVVRKSMSPKLRRVAEKVKERYNVTFRNISLKNLGHEIKLIKEIYNDAWSKNWGFVPFTDEEINYLADQLKQIADEELLIIAEKATNPIAFILSLPNINEILIRIPNGRLFPTGIFKLLFGMKKIRSIRVITLGVKRDYQTLGLGSIFYMETIERATKRGYNQAELSWILEDNHPMNSAIKAMGSKLYKTYRIYQYPLT